MNFDNRVCTQYKSFLFGAIGRDHVLQLYLPTLDLAQQPHPGEDLRQGEGQGEVVGDVVIAHLHHALVRDASSPGHSCARGLTFWLPSV